MSSGNLVSDSFTRIWKTVSSLEILKKISSNWENTLQHPFLKGQFGKKKNKVNRKSNSVVKDNMILKEKAPEIEAELRAIFEAEGFVPPMFDDDPYETVSESLRKALISNQVLKENCKPRDLPWYVDELVDILIRSPDPEAHVESTFAIRQQERFLEAVTALSYKMDQKAKKDYDYCVKTKRNIIAICVLNILAIGLTIHLFIFI